MKEQKEEAERFKQKQQELEDLKTESYLVQLFHIDRVSPKLSRRTHRCMLHAEWEIVCVPSCLLRTCSNCVYFVGIIIIPVHPFVACLSPYRFCLVHQDVNEHEEDIKMMKAELEEALEREKEADAVLKARQMFL